MCGKREMSEERRLQRTGHVLSDIYGISDRYCNCTYDASAGWKTEDRHVKGSCLLLVKAMPLCAYSACPFLKSQMIQTSPSTWGSSTYLSRLLVIADADKRHPWIQSFPDRKWTLKCSSRYLPAPKNTCSTPSVKLRPEIVCHGSPECQERYLTLPS